MGTKDITEKHLIEIDEIFADIINGTIFNGKQIVKENELQDIPMKSQFKADSNKIHEQERDIAKRWSKDGVIFSILGIENQTAIDKDMPLRVISYDGASYKSQLLKKNDLRRYPVITIVLYYGKELWAAPKSLKECLDIPDYLESYVSDYRINVFDITHMTDHEIDKLFHSDFKAFAKVVKDIDNADKIDDKIDHPDEMLKLLSTFTGDERFTELEGIFKGGTNMCEIIDRYETKGKIEAFREIAENLYKNGVSIDVIKSSIPDIPKDEVQKIFDQITKNN